ncbi:MAG: PD-(D/E)XK nuclease family protein [Deltaproteobacteria bacterium]|nr:PD-(D/E)XK nuclease family protein [Deltaproteobacteria bacterium]
MSVAAEMLDPVDRQVRARRANDPWGPLDVVCPSPGAAAELRLGCARRGALVGVRFGTLGPAARRLAWGEAEVPDRPAWPEGGDVLRAASLLRARRDSYYAPIADRPGTAAALAAALSELSWHGFTPSAVEAAARAAARTRPVDGTRLGELAEHLAALLEARRRFATGPAVYAAALDALRREPGLARSLVVAGPVEATGLAAALLGRLRELGTPFVPLVPAVDPARTIVVSSAVGEAAECREALREALLAAEQLDLPLSRVAVLPVRPVPYLELFAEAGESLGVPLDLTQGVRLSETPEGTALRDALALPAAGFPRARTLDLLRHRCLDPAAAGALEPPADPTAWDRLSRACGVVAGLDDFRARLEPATLGRRAVEARQLLAVVERLGEDLPPAAGCDCWTTAARLLRRFLERWLRPSETRDELVARAGELAALEALDEPGRRVGPVELRRMLDRLLDHDARQHPTRVPGGLVVAESAAVAGRSFGAVVVPGLAADVWPAPPPPDPVLPDEDRRRLNDARPADAVPLPTAADRARREQEAFARTLGAAERRLVLLFPSRDPSTGHARLPSPALLDALPRAGATLPRAEPTVRAAAARRAASVAMLPLSPLEDAPAGRLDGPRQAAAAAAFDRRAPFLRARLRADRSRRDPSHLGPWAGDVSSSPTARAAAAALARAPLSASRLETFASCPLRFLFGYLLELRPLDDPEEAYPFDAREQGSAFHALAERLFGELREGGALPLRDVQAAHARAVALAEPLLEQVAARVPARQRVRFDADRARWLAALRPWLEHEAATGDAADGSFERVFGAPGRRGDGGTGVAAAVPLPSGAVVQLGGYIDRADLAAGGAVDLIDYKTGLPRSTAKGLDGGRSLQLAVYAVAARALWPDRAVRRLIFRHVVLGEGRVADVEFPPELARVETLGPLLERLVAGIAGAAYPHCPGRGARQPPCSFCDHTLLCGPAAAREALALLKAGTPERRAALAFRETDDSCAEAEPRNGGRP